MRIVSRQGLVRRRSSRIKYVLPWIWLERPSETMETVRLFSHASDVQTGYLLITVAWCPCYSYCPANREAIAFNDMVTNGGKGKPWVAAVTVYFYLLLQCMSATEQTRKKSVVLAFVGTGIRTKWWKEAQECWLLHHSIHLRMFADMLDPLLDVLTHIRLFFFV